jgi:IS30 family transposase
MGRKKIPIDWNKVDNYLKAHCDGAAIARILGIHPDTLYKNVKEIYKIDFSAYAAQKRDEGAALMVASIYRDAITKGGIDRIFWLKNKAGWSDKQEISHELKNELPFNITINHRATE